MNEYQSKTTNAKLAKLKQSEELKKASDKKNEAKHNELLASIGSLQADISALEASLSVNGSAYTESQKDLAQNFRTLKEILEAGLNVTNIKDIKQAKEIIVSNLKDIPKPVVNTSKTEIPKWLASEKSVKTLNNSVMKVVQALIDLEANIKPKQEPEEFVPFRRVIRQGNRLVFDDSDWASRGGGGGSGGGSSTGGLTDAELRATPVPVSMSSDIEIGAVELKNGTDDTRATITAGNALKVDGSAVTQPVSGTVTATPTGTQNVDVTANTIGLATSANQTNGNQIAVAKGDVASGSADSGNPVKVGAKYNSTQPTFTDGQRADMQVDSRGNLRMGLYANNTQTTASFKADNADADATSATANKLGVMSRGTVYNGTTWDRQLGDATNGTLVNLGANNDVTVTSGAITETNSAAIKTAVETIDNAIAGSEMQVDVVGALPAGTNAIGKLAANSGVDIGDVDVTSTVLPTGAGTSSVTSVADTTTSATLKASNTSRKQIIIQNTSSAILYVKYGATATSSDFTVLLNQNDILVEDHYTGIIDGIWATDPGDGAAKVTEIS